MSVRRPLLTVTALALGAVALVACTSTGEGDPSPSPTETTSVPAEETTEPGGGDASPTEGATTPTAPGEDTTTAADDAGVPVADEGACLRAEDLIPVLTEGGELSSLPTVDCSVAHEVEIFAVYDMPDGAFPGDAPVQAQAQAECETRFEEFVGVPVANSSLSVAPITPSEGTWEVGDRTVYCLAVGPEATTESFEGSGL